MLKKLKEFIDFKLKYAEKYARTVSQIENCRAQAYGALMFLEANNLVTYEETKEMWDKAYDKFHKLMLDIPNKK